MGRIFQSFTDVNLWFIKLWFESFFFAVCNFYIHIVHTDSYIKKDKKKYPSLPSFPLTFCLSLCRSIYSFIPLWPYCVEERSDRCGSPDSCLAYSRMLTHCYISQLYVWKWICVWQRYTLLVRMHIKQLLKDAYVEKHSVFIWKMVVLAVMLIESMRTNITACAIKVSWIVE